MTNGKDEEFETALKAMEVIAERYERQIPHVSDLIYSLVKLVRNYDIQAKLLIKIYLNEKRKNEILYKQIKCLKKIILRKSKTRRKKR